MKYNEDFNTRRGMKTIARRGKAKLESPRSSKDASSRDREIGPLTLINLINSSTLWHCVLCVGLSCTTAAWGKLANCKRNLTAEPPATLPLHSEQVDPPDTDIQSNQSVSVSVRGEGNSATEVRWSVICLEYKKEGWGDLSGGACQVRPGIG
ncbi:hypothetical protein B0J18DRAFT_117513 [Chaetomium sp. MPI-SDFR-AT-0129]|nr:hypothetical protein B0J18DRAFT_117513 [Chaetomium sp. MPI-SDFR-AT-0129]